MVFDVFRITAILINKQLRVVEVHLFVVYVSIYPDSPQAVVFLMSIIDVKVGC